ncbi:MAG: redoxin domain-containing protein [Candidatus Liptonbacteria bacterium]|nr:redoxin domain-containing protein [Candidatus Liptonbacteria bacterium]
MKHTYAVWVAVAVVVVGAVWYFQSRSGGPGAAGGDAISEEEAVQKVVAGASPVAPLLASAMLEAVAAADKEAGYVRAPELAAPAEFLNSTPFTLADALGKKVILLNFWTYSCINCIRTLPYLNAWYEKYRAQGLEVVGVHTPKFEFEKEKSNVETARARYGITYPVVLDNSRGTWDAYANLYWPHAYVIDPAGYIVHERIGEGGYEETEAVIQKLLEVRAIAVGAPVPTSTPHVAVAGDASESGNPETYFGSARNEFLGNGTKGAPGAQTFVLPAQTLRNKLYLGGAWDVRGEYAAATAAKAKILYKYEGKKVFFVGRSQSGVSVQVLQDGKPVSAAAGSDVKGGAVRIGEGRIYELVSNPGSAGEHTLELIIESPGLEAYTLTFG